MLKEGAVRVLGMMSGTSLDGVDAAVIETDGTAITGLGEHGYRSYSDQERDVLRAALGRWPGEPGVAEAAELVERAHAELMVGFSDVALAGFHGQTLAHEPDKRGTHQAGDGRVLAAALGVPVVWDFRSSDVQMGGQGAPLAPAYHFALAKWIGAETPLAFLNLGGVGNVTWVDPAKSAPEEAGALLAFDTGPANAPINDLMQARRGLPFDEDGALAAAGVVSVEILDAFAAHGYFLKYPPKSLDRDDFSGLQEQVADLSDADAAATLTAAAAVAVVRAAEFFPAPVERLLVTGGGRLNPVLMTMLSEGMGCTVEPVEAVGLDGDMLEAQAFAFLAMRVMRGLPTSFPATTGVAAAVGGGEISTPFGQ
ncbi:anhydro-N-acetylmuramic acid kinase [Tropicimonas sp. TH_r6]|uniref:anhydro-N-acetylmuramic acid kinase n=1 Tax=Tropicimonas sp. TH_r6 TaxID=3082085 RepID=UPI0029546C66|nr:anhydro-N-acetylmuramic acid kinase [Tropicimonas sp. TH_r6]MDV7141539.1 anhydro-N-acetylmuramic acid kinase [Tropicimonas sp. TH_r6]